MLANGQEEAAIRGMMDITTDDLQTALEGWHAEVRPLAQCSEQTVDRFVQNEIGGFINLTMMNSRPEALQAFSDQVLIEVAEVPMSLLLPAIREARRTVSFANALVPFIFKHVEERMNKLRAEGEQLEKLMVIANGQ